MTEVMVIWGVILFLPFLGHSLEVKLVVGFGEVVLFIVELLVVVVVVVVLVEVDGLDSLTVVVTGVGIV